MERTCVSCIRGHMNAGNETCKACLSSLNRPFWQSRYGPVKEDALKTQVDGDHYKNNPIQPIEYIHANGLGFCEGNVVKYVTRWKFKGGVGDLEKARHYLDILIQLESRNDSAGNSKV